MSLLNNNIDDNEINNMLSLINKYYPNKYILPESVYIKYIKKYKHILLLMFVVFFCVYMGKPFFIMKKIKNKLVIDYNLYFYYSSIITVCIYVSYKIYLYNK